MLYQSYTQAKPELSQSYTMPNDVYVHLVGMK